MKVCEWEMRRQIRQGLKLMSSNFYDFLYMSKTNAINVKCFKFGDKKS